MWFGLFYVVLCSVPTRQLNFLVPQVSLSIVDYYEAENIHVFFICVPWKNFSALPYEASSFAWSPFVHKNVTLALCAEKCSCAPKASPLCSHRSYRIIVLFYKPLFSNWFLEAFPDIRQNLASGKEKEDHIALPKYHVDMMKYTYFYIQQMEFLCHSQPLSLLLRDGLMIELMRPWPQPLKWYGTLASHIIT